MIEILPVLCYTFFTQIFLGIVLPFYICIGFSLTGALCSLLAGRTKIGRDGQDIKQKEEPENGQSEESHDQHKRKR